MALVTVLGGPVAAQPPPTRRDDVRDTLHGVEIVDPYRWLEDQHSPETRAWIDAENAYTQSLLGKLPGREAIAARLAEIVKTDHVYSPSIRGNRYFLYRRRADEQLPVYVMREGRDGQDQVLLDPTTLSADLTVSAEVLDLSEDGKWLVYGRRQGGEDEVAVHLLEVDTRRDLGEELPRAQYYGCELLPDDRTLYYAVWSETDGPRVYRHTVGTPRAQDVCLFGEGYSPSEMIGVSVSTDGRWLLLSVYYGERKTEVYLKDLQTDGPLVTVVKDIEAHFYCDVVDNRLYIHTNWKAPNQRLLVADAEAPQLEHWRELLPERKLPLDSYSLVGGRLFAAYLKNVLTKVIIFDLEGRQVGEVRAPGVGTLSNLDGRWDQDEGFFSFSSFNTPWTIYRYQVSTGESSVWSRLNVQFASDDYEVRQVWFPSKDGTRVPMFITHRKGLVPDGSHPTLLTGYGGFTVSMQPDFGGQSAIWLEHGGVYAVANLRGGGEFGEAWHEAGMLGRKQNVFDDFAGAAQYLIAEGYTRPDRLAITGTSNGGLLVGAALTQHPELFQAAVCGYPLLDMLRYHTLLVAPFWVPEYGSSEDPEQFRYLLAYSPYQNIHEGTKYPAVLFTTGDSDTRVDPMHARKMCARLQAATGSDRPVLLYYDTKLGHSGGRSVDRAIEDDTLELSFLMWQLGMLPGG